MTDLPDVRPISTDPTSNGRPERAGLDSVLPGLEPGWYRAADLLPRYNSWAKGAGRAEATAKQLGEALYQAGLKRRKAHGNISAYWVTGQPLDS